MSDHLQDHAQPIDGADLFISYAWTPGQHREWVRLLASHLKMLGYHVLIDADVDYGDSLNGFMRRIRQARHVLMIIDENYVDRADDHPGSGVEIENRWISEAHPNQSPTWLSVLFKDNPHYRLPAWLTESNPKGISFNSEPDADDFPGADQLEQLWRWIEGLPANDDHATRISTLRQRAARLERHALRTAPEQWRNPSLTGESHFEYDDAPAKEFTFGFGERQFTLYVSGCGNDSVYVMKDPIKAVGVIHLDQAPETELEAHLSAGRTVQAHEGQTVVLMNSHGSLAVVEIVKVQRGSTTTPYVAPYLDFRWRIVDEVS